MRIVQIAPVIGPGTGVGAVAHHLEQEWRAAGIRTARLTLAEAHGGWLPEPGPGLRGKLVLALRVVWFSTVGTVVARRFLRRHPDAVAVCHNDAVAGHVYVNHGIVQVAMRARGHLVLRMLRNPVHLLIAARDTLRYSTGVHRVVVNLVAAEETALRATYPRLAPRTVVIGNGVDVERYQPPDAGQRSAARARLGLTEDDHVLLFVGHEFARKGLPVVLDALTRLPDRHHLLVVGGTPDMVADLRREGAARGLGRRLHLLGPLPDPRPAFHAADVLVQPSAYESFGLVVLEALACGVPVVATPTGCVPEVVTDAVTGYVRPAEAAPVAAAVQALADADRAALAAASRRRALEHSWHEVAGRYVAVLAELAGPQAGGPRSDEPTTGETS